MHFDARTSTTMVGLMGAALIWPVVAPSVAAATPGDETLSYGPYSVELATNQCKGASDVITTQGGPYPARTDIVVYAVNAYSSCVSRVKLVYTDGRRSFSTGYAYSPGRKENAVAAMGVYRCYVEFGVRRNDGSYYTRNQVNNTHNREMPAGCPA